MFTERGWILSAYCSQSLRHLPPRFPGRILHSLVFQPLPRRPFLLAEL